MPNHPQGFDIKSSELSTLNLLLKTDALSVISDQLLAQYEVDAQGESFFDNDPVVIDFSLLTTPPVEHDIDLLLNALEQCKLRAVAFHGEQAQWIQALQARGLFAATPIVKKSQPKETIEVVREIEVIKEIKSPSTMLIDKPLRSGQKVYAKGCDLIVTAIVNQGAEVAADGNIHVYAPLRGKAMAGARGNMQARIFSTCFEPELVAIAGVYRTSENTFGDDVLGKPTQVRLSEDGREKLLVESIKS